MSKTRLVWSTAILEDEDAVVEAVESHGEFRAKVWSKGDMLRVYVTRHGSRDCGYISFHEPSGRWYSNITGGARSPLNAILGAFENYVAA